MTNILIVFGTRPEAIKLAPLIIEFKKHPKLFDAKVCVSAQHRQMLDQVLDFFNIIPDYDLNIMKDNQTLFDVTVNCLKGIEKVLDEFKPDIVFTQGDTTTAFTGALAAFYKKIKVAHVEAGLRSGNKYSPFPEEINRILAGHIADYHFAPTEQARINLQNEGITDNVAVVTNTVIDALFLGLEIIRKNGSDKYSRHFNFVDFNKRIILVTGHRRESFGAGFENICNALTQIVNNHQDVEIVYPVHLNPNVREPVFRLLGHNKRIHIIEPLDYPHLIWLMNQCFLVITDSGGIQEEAPSLGKPVLVIRDVTERMEGIEAGTAKLVGTSTSTIYDEARRLLSDTNEYERMSKAHNPYGDGLASRRIVEYFINNLDISSFE
jgi:UDP-N-acetylglucosamine 2-epimerase (non-hydrolysing)